jgi:hypothetical protein
MRHWCFIVFLLFYLVFDFGNKLDKFSILGSKPRTLFFQIEHVKSIYCVLGVNSG